jgi:hypothetical protein
MSKSKGSRTATVTTHYDGGGGNKVSVPEGEWAGTRTNDKGETEALVSTGGDSGGQTREWVKVDR